MDRLQQIRARLTVHEEGYAVHVPCGSEAEAPLGRFTCCKCGPVPRHEVVAPALPGGLEEPMAGDIRYLLDIVEGRQRLHTTIDRALDDHLKGTT